MSSENNGTISKLVFGSSHNGSELHEVHYADTSSSRDLFLRLGDGALKLFTDGYNPTYHGVMSFLQIKGFKLVHTSNEGPHLFLLTFEEGGATKEADLGIWKGRPEVAELWVDMVNEIMKKNILYPDSEITRKRA